MARRGKLSRAGREPGVTDRPDITPETRVGALLEAYPELEPVLIEFAPAFNALRNPVLRRTVAQVATLRRAAGVAGVPARELVVALRKAAGLPVDDCAADDAALDSASCLSQAPVTGDEKKRGRVPAPRPDWRDDSRVCVTLNADELLAAGETPLTRVTQALRDHPGGVVRLVSSFEPTPLLEALEKAGHRVWCVRGENGNYTSYFAPRAP